MRRRRRTRTPSLDPNVMAVNSLISEAARGNRLRIRQAEAGATGLRASLAERSKQLKSAYDDVDRLGAEASARANAATASLSPAADPMKAIIAGEQSSGLRRSVEARARAGEEVGRIGTSIEREKSSRIHQSGQDFSETLRQIAGEAAKVGSEEAKDRADRALKRRQQSITRRGQTLSHRDRQAKLKTDREKDAYQRKHKLGPYKPASKNGRGKNGSKARFTPLQKREAHEDLRRAIGLAGDLHAAGVGKGKGQGKTLVSALLAGNKDQGVDPVKHPTIARAAAFYAKYGKLDRKTRRTLLNDFGIGGR